MLELKVKTRGNASPQGKARVYFTCHPGDFDRCFERLTEDILGRQDCAVYYTADMSERIEPEDQKLQLGRMNLFVIPVSLKLLLEPNRAMDEDFAFAVREHIPVLPIVLEPGLDPVYSRKDRFGDRHYLSPESGTDGSGLSYGEKLGKYLKTVLPGVLFETAAGYARRGEHRKAKELWEKIYTRRCEVLGEEHPDTLTALHKLALTLEKLGDTDGAIESMEKVYTLRRKVLGREHLTTMAALGGLVGLMEKRGKRKGALGEKEAFYTQLCLLFGEEDPATLRALGELADACDEAGDQARALELWEKVWALYCKVLGEKDRESLNALNSLALTCGKLGDYRRELELDEKIYALRCQTQGEKHPDTLWSLNNLALTRRDLGDGVRAGEELKQALAGMVENYGEEHPDTLAVKANLARTLDELGETEEALRLCEEILASKAKLTERVAERAAGVFERRGMPEKAARLRARTGRE